MYVHVDEGCDIILYSSSSYYNLLMLALTRNHLLTGRLYMLIPDQRTRKENSYTIVDHGFPM